MRSVPDDANVITIDSNLLYNSISRSLFATAQDELRPVMNGIYFDLAADSLTVVASDGHKLVRSQIIMFPLHSSFRRSLLLCLKTFWDMLTKMLLYASMRRVLNSNILMDSLYVV